MPERVILIHILGGRPNVPGFKHRMGRRCDGSRRERGGAMVGVDTPSSAVRPNPPLSAGGAAAQGAAPPADGAIISRHHLDVRPGRQAATGESTLPRVFTLGDAVQRADARWGGRAARLREVTRPSAAPCSATAAEGERSRPLHPRNNVAEVGPFLRTGVRNVPLAAARL